MMRKIIGKIIDLIIPVVEEGAEGEEGEQEGKPTRVITLDQILGGGAQAQKEPDLRVIGLYSDVSDEKIAELTEVLKRRFKMESQLTWHEEKDFSASKAQADDFLKDTHYTVEWKWTPYSLQGEIKNGDEVVFKGNAHMVRTAARKLMSEAWFTLGAIARR